MSDQYFHTHVHSHYSAVDAMASVPELVEKAAAMGQPGLALTDHGVLSGCYELYQECKKVGIKPFPGLEGYLVHDVNDKSAKRYHITLLAYNSLGVAHLNRLSSITHLRENYRYKPLMDFALLDALSGVGQLEGIVAFTGCYFGWVQQAFVDAPYPQGYAMALKRAETISQWFDKTFVEVQHHDQDIDDEMVKNLRMLATELDLPMIATQDCHHLHKSHRDLHSMMKQMVYGGDPGDVTFPGDSYHLSTTRWVRDHYDPDLWDEMQWSYDWLLVHHDVELTFLDQFQLNLPPMKGNLEQAAKLEWVRKGISTSYLGRLTEELDVIRQARFENYFLFVADYCRWARQQGIAINCRGSANGSLVCWLLGITEVDPIKWDCDFSRFLTVDRERPPDIDMDVETDRRGELIDYIRSKVKITNIGTYNRLGFNENDQGSILVTYLSAMRKRLGDEYQEQLGHVKFIEDLDHDTAVALRKLNGFMLFRGPGVHAAGYALDTPQHPMADWMPTMLIPSSDTTVTQMTMDDVEDAGFIKIDMLGIRTLGIVRRCMEMLGKPDWNWIPLNDAKTFSMLRRGYTDTGVFQLEGYTAARGCKEVGVKHIEDIVLVNALYRPATMQGGYTRLYLRRREGTVKWEHHPLLAKHLDATYGIAVYQEQVLAILRDLGFTASERMKLLKAVKMSNSKVARALKDFHAAKVRFDKLCDDAGMDDEQIETAWGMVEGYSNYGFNRAHSVAYALLGYRTAYLLANHPLEYMACLLTAWSGTPKEKLYTRLARRKQIRVMPPDVNMSGTEWGIDHKRNALRRPLTSIAGVGSKAAVDIEENRPYVDYADFLNRTDTRLVSGGKKPAQPNGVILKLINAGAMKQLDGVPNTLDHDG